MAVRFRSGLERGPGPVFRTAPFSLTLVRPVDAMVWELRAAWGAGWRVALTLDERCVVDRLEGTVDHVSATGAWVEVAGWHVPTDAVLAVHRPSRLGDSTARTAWSRPAYVPPQREELSSDDVGRP